MIFSKQYYTYIVEGNDGNFYTGMTNNIRKRINQHNGRGFWSGARYTKSRRPVFLVHLEKYISRSEAHKRELEIKKYTHLHKGELIEGATKEDILNAI